MSTHGNLQNQNRFLIVLREERSFLAVILLSFIVVGGLFNQPQIAMWLGFLFAGYSAIANDSIQTIGTFIASNRGQKWWVLWGFMGSILVGTIVYSWMNYGGDISYGRLSSKGFAETPTSFNALQVMAPIFLLILTRMRMPVSTSFLLLTCMATHSGAIDSMVSKSLLGYGIAMICAMVLWGTLGRWMNEKFVGEPHPAWRIAQWISSGFLWSQWLAQDAANIAVYLPRQLSAVELGVVVSILAGGLGFLFYRGGDKIQDVIEEKSSVVDVRPATVIDFLYALILFYFKGMNDVPMSTTWVFVGLLGGREIAMAFVQAGDRGVKDAFKLMAKDVIYVTTGLLVSLAIAFFANPCIAARLTGTAPADFPASCDEYQEAHAEALVVDEVEATDEATDTDN